MIGVEWNELSAQDKLDRLCSAVASTIEVVTQMERRQRLAAKIFADLNTRLGHLEEEQFGKQRAPASVKMSDVAAHLRREYAEVTGGDVDAQPTH